MVSEPMSTTNSGAKKTRPTDDDESFEFCRESPAQGGARYAKCTDCGVEVMPDLRDHVQHRSGCSQA